MKKATEQGSHRLGKICVHDHFLIFHDRLSFAAFCGNTNLVQLRGGGEGGIGKIP